MGEADLWMQARKHCVHGIIMHQMRLSQSIRIRNILEACVHHWSLKLYDPIEPRNSKGIVYSITLLDSLSSLTRANIKNSSVLMDVLVLLAITNLLYIERVT